MNNPINGKFPKHAHTSSYKRICLPLLLFWGFAGLFFHGNYFTSSTATPYRIHSCHGNICGRKKKKERQRQRERECKEDDEKKKEKKKVFTVDREITGFIIYSQLIPSVTDDRATAGPVKELVFVFER